MKRIEPKQAALFVLVFGGIAFLLAALANSLRDPLQQIETRTLSPRHDNRLISNAEEGRRIEQDEARRAKKAADDAAAQRAKFLARYLNPGFSRKAGAKVAAMTAVSEHDKFNRALSAAIAQRFTTNSVQIAPALFTPEFISDGLFNAAFDDPRKTFQSLELANSVDALLFARQKVRYAKNPSLENVITATMELEVALLPADFRVERQSWTFVASGAGFSEPAARTLAEERLLKHLTNDTQMSFAAILNNP